MTLKTSLFNKGIYKSTVRRYLWGAVLYFIILFMSTVLPILLTVEADDTYRYMGENNLSLLYDNGTYLFLPITIAMGVATVVGLLVYRFIHSKKASVFTHSLPVNRTSVYTSTLAGAFTLMFVPVILNGLIFLVMALTSYSKIISVSSCFVWIGLNLLCLFMMFACTTFVAMLTGNTFATVALNVLFHALVPVVVVCFGFVAEQFLYGYVTDNAVMNSVVENNFVVWIYRTINNTVYWHDETVFDFTKMYIYLGISVLLYVLGWVLYKKRNLETAEDVAGFKILNPIFKYLITFVGVIATFTVFGSFISHNPVTFWIIVAIIGVVIYFACEMILKKTLKVWSSYKGLIGFSIVFALMICVFAFTSFFGYETYVPDADKVDSLAVYEYYNGKDEPFTDDKDVIEYVEKLHNELIQPDNVYITYPDIDGKVNQTRIHIKYKLKNGKDVVRAYMVSISEKYEIMNNLHNFTAYKYANERILSYKPQEIYRMTLYNSENGSLTISDLEEIEELQNCLDTDILKLDYNQIYLDEFWSRQLSIEIGYKEEDRAMSVDYIDYHLNRNFKNTINWFRENGYGDYIDSDYERDFYVIYKPNFSKTEEEIVSSAVELTKLEFLKDGYACFKSADIKSKIIMYLNDNYINYYPDQNYYYVICMRDNGGYEILGILSEEDAQKLVEDTF